MAGLYQLIAGERRLRALQLLGWAAAPAIVRAIRDTELLEAALVENLQREPLTPIEEAQALRDLLERHGYTQESLAGRIGRDRSTISNLVRLLELPLPIQEDLEAGRLSAGHARALLSVTDTVLQIGLRNEVVRRALTVRETERLIRIQSSDASAPAEEPVGAEPALTLEYQAARQTLERKLGTKVGIRESGGRGSVELEFYSLDDFNRIFDVLMGKRR
jgi:ParB family chromosome partitioning protein